MLPMFTTLLVFQVIGEVLALATALREATTGLLQRLSLLFVPADVEVTAHYGRIAGQLPAVVGSVVASSVRAGEPTAVSMPVLLASAWGLS